jgi:peptidoglycan hydrolase-like protein with peptidoglycan-binding domain
MELDREAQTIERRRATRATPQHRRVAPTPPARALKESLGNQAAQLFVARLQRKPTVSAPDDPLERQADVVADRVMRMSQGDVVQRVCKECEEEKKEQPQIQRTVSADSGAGLDVSGAVSAAQRSGAPLPADVRSFFEPRFGHDFSGVRVHTGGEAARAARGTEARAYTFGRDIVFGANEYAPHTAEGRRLLAHELAHVVQQGGSQSIQRRVLTAAEQAAAITANRALFNSLTVRVLQTITGVPAANRDGVIGPQTVRAISDWQTARGLVDNGIVNDASMDRLVTDSLAAGRAEHGIQLVLDFFNLNTAADTLAVRHRTGAFTFEGLRFVGLFPVGVDISPAATTFEEGNLRVIEVGDSAFASARTLRDTIQRELARAGPARPPVGATPARLNAAQVRAAVRFTASKYSDPRSVRAIQGLVGAPVTGIFDATTVQFIAEDQHTAGIAVDGKVGLATTENFYTRMIGRGNPNSALRLLVDFFDLRDQGNLLSIFFDPTVTAFASTDFRPSEPVRMRIGPTALALPFSGTVHTIAHEMEHVRRLREGIGSRATQEFLGEAVEILSVGMPEEPLGAVGDGLFIDDATRCLNQWNLMSLADRRRFRNRFIAVRRKVLRRIDAGTAPQRAANAALRARYVAVALP